MPERHSARPFVPGDAHTLPEFKEAADACEGCELYRDATQAVLGEGPADAEVVLIGEMPGDEEDRSGRPFVGPAGRMLDRALHDAGLDRLHLYITNAVKHFSFAIARGMRLHKTPKASQIAACRPWLEAELALLKPRLLVAMGASAAHAVFGRRTTIGPLRGIVQDTPLGPRAVVTIHPSSILRQRERAERHAAYAGFVADLQAARRHLVGD